ncbi:unnamed protein product [Vitrella brassicaformis CCMP3155]|uniref:Uncharacterized protein n=1 Tax=Vitrella brassicaformis (strain CCMP3155) TaxID=1169540 RepID=A0A0G4G4E7_VITBC|nr:unnamed protein product [Vitrella brassicaformis CCMP3155]|eukprot:CEM22809.1 unnamed protein product [Vitrella brassicaformis CCMP3155]
MVRHITVARDVFVRARRLQCPRQRCKCLRVFVADNRTDSAWTGGRVRRIDAVTSAHRGQLYTGGGRIVGPDYEVRCTYSPEHGFRKNWHEFHPTKEGTALMLV